MPFACQQADALAVRMICFATQLAFQKHPKSLLGVLSGLKGNESRV
jgi:hypothetical protein